MRRRTFIGLIAAATAWPLAGLAQESGQTKRVGVIMGLSETNPEYRGFLDAFREELTRLATADQRGLQIEQHWTNADPGRARRLVKEMVRTKPDVLFASTTPVVAALHEETPSIPIVFAIVSDPVGAKLVDGLGHPGGNITGFVQTEARLGGKWLALLKEAAPNVKRAALMFNPEVAPGRGALHQGSFEAAAKSLGIEPLSAPVRDGEEIQTAIAGLGAERGGLVLVDDAFMALNYRIAIAAAARANVPSISALDLFAADGGLMAYYTDMIGLFRGAAGYVDRILRGEKPADLPVQMPSKYHLAINLKTAKALGIEIPPLLLASADEVIE